jgi:hypothetical protein
MLTIRSAGIQTSGTIDESTDEARTEGPIVEFAEPMLLPKDLSFCEASLWERPIADNVEPCLPPALHHAITVKARDASITVTCVELNYTTLQCHVCGEFDLVSQNVIHSMTDGCPVGMVSQDESAALSIVQRATLAEPTAPASYTDD